MPLTLPHVGPLSSQLGSSLAVCPGAGFVAGAPGTGTAWHSPTDATPLAQGHGLGRTVGCYSNTSSTTEMVAGGDAGMRLVVNGDWASAFSASSTLSISTPDSPTLPILGGTTSAFLLYSRTTGTALNAVAGISVPAVQWYRGQPRFAVTVAVGSTVRIYDLDPMNGLTQVETIIGTAPGFGRSLAVGDVLPAPGDELIIGATGAVYVYLHDGSGPVMQLSGADSSFGASLATAPYGLGLDQLFVGQPASDDVYRFIGDAGEVFLSVLDTERFGASLAANAGVLAIGAPEHLQGSGAVYQELLALASPTGEVQECEVGRACFSQGCLAGECVGGVWCELSAAFFACQPGETCSLGRCLDSDGGLVVRDAGVPIDDGGVVIGMDAGVSPLPDASVQLDAGELDAGKLDAGSIDAGSIDAGVLEPADAGGARDAGADDAGAEESDAGVKPPKDAGVDQDAGLRDGSEPMIFTTSGCSESAALPVLALVLALLRRRLRWTLTPTLS